MLLSKNASATPVGFVAIEQINPIVGQSYSLPTTVRSSFPNINISGVPITRGYILALGVLIWRPWRSRFGYHFGFPLPPTAKLIVAKVESLIPSRSKNR